ncbi:zinc-binding dehydrogenase [Azohydromonas lata]|uniref:Zinc-binding dehydrogenase n=1 Tax=Azohydromonas lata TaxID=45677 RepID=A0ABU5IAV6_9BURK|nr:zinc-binding dehydrogenase [Azohydromonas lata]MDZ5455675.1 zinc-binding dehydrogenase [Azohydromonas lata]
MSNAVVIRENGDASVLRYEATSTGDPDSREILVRQEAVGVNFVDSLVRSGQFGVQLPAVIGFEAAGIVEQVGSDQVSFKVGDRVGYFYAQGAYADYNLVDSNSLIALPPDISTVQAAAFLAKGLTAWMGLRAMHKLKAGDVILVQGASGSVGSIVSRWAKHCGATVIGVAGSKQKLAQVAAGSTLALAADDAFFMNKVRALAPQGVDVVYDFVGDATAKLSLAAVRDGGKILTIGAASGQARFDRAELARRSIQILGGGTPQYVNTTNQAAASAELFDVIRAGVFADLEITKHRLDTAADVHRALDARRLNGLPVLIP